MILFVLDATQATDRIGPGDRYVARLVAESGTPAIAVINKVDLLRNREEVLPIVEEVSELGDWREIFPISAAEGLNIEPLMEAVIELLPPGPRYFPEGKITDYPESLILAEYVREKALNVLRRRSRMQWPSRSKRSSVRRALQSSTPRSTSNGPHSA